MTGYIYLNQQISSRTAVGSRLTFFTDTDALAIVDTGRYRYLDLLSGRGISGSTAGTAFVLDHLTGSVTVRTSLNITYHTKHGLLGVNDLALAFTFRTCDR